MSRSLGSRGWRVFVVAVMTLIAVVGVGYVAARNRWVIVGSGGVAQGDYYDVVDGVVCGVEFVRCGAEGRSDVAAVGGHDRAR